MRDQLTVSANYMIDFNNCQVSKTDYLASNTYLTVNQKFGTVIYKDTGDYYIESATNFSNGLNGGN